MQLVKGEARLKQILVADKDENPIRIINVLKSDILNVLKNYMEISNSDLELNITCDEFGFFVFNSYCRARRLKSLGAIIEN